MTVSESFADRKIRAIDRKIEALEHELDIYPTHERDTSIHEYMLIEKIEELRDLRRTLNNEK